MQKHLTVLLNGLTDDETTRGKMRLRPGMDDDDIHADIGHHFMTS